jgi:hypothetical protein
VAPNYLWAKTLTLLGSGNKHRSWPVWLTRQLFRVAHRMTKPPVLIDGLALLSGYCWAAVRGVERCVTPELMRFHRREQMQKLRAIFRSILRFKKVDNFSLLIDETH